MINGPLNCLIELISLNLGGFEGYKHMTTGFGVIVVSNFNRSLWITFFKVIIIEINYFVKIEKEL